MGEELETFLAGWFCLESLMRLQSRCWPEMQGFESWLKLKDPLFAFKIVLSHAFWLRESVCYHVDLSIGLLTALWNLQKWVMKGRDQGRSCSAFHGPVSEATYLLFILFINSKSPNSVHIQEERNWTPPLKGSISKSLWTYFLNYQTEFLVEDTQGLLVPWAWRLADWSGLQTCVCDGREDLRGLGKEATFRELEALELKKWQFVPSSRMVNTMLFLKHRLNYMKWLGL